MLNAHSTRQFQFVRVHPEFIFGIHLHIGYWLEFRFVEGRKLRFGHAEFLKMIAGVAESVLDAFVVILQDQFICQAPFYAASNGPYQPRDPKPASSSSRRLADRGVRDTAGPVPAALIGLPAIE